MARLVRPRHIAAQGCAESIGAAEDFAGRQEVQKYFRLAHFEDTYGLSRKALQETRLCRSGLARGSHGSDRARSQYVQLFTATNFFRLT